MESCEVLVVGAGPTGLVLANRLGQQGIACVVVDQASGPPTQSMAIGIMPPSLDILRELDLDQPLIRRGVPVSRAYVYEEGQQLGCVAFDHIPSRYPFILSLPQRTTIELLENSLARWPCVQLRRDTELVGWREDDERVFATVQTPTGTAQIAARFLAGCDGHRSAVRKLAGIPAVESRYGTHFAMADYHDQSDLGPAAHLFFGSRGSVESFPLPGNLRRWIVLTPPEHGADDKVAVICRRVCEETGHDLSRQEPLAHSRFAPKWLLCGRFHRGRIVLAGDAAHVMSPIGGQGMNSGFADVEHLSDVLVRILRRGAAPTPLLRTYTQFRRRSFRTAAARAARGMWLGTRTGRFASKLRSWLIRGVLLRRPIGPRLAPYFAMMTLRRASSRGSTSPAARAMKDGAAGALRPRADLSLDSHLQVPELKRAYNERLFTRVARSYGFVTRALSLGRDAAWKRRLVAALPEMARPVCVDLACGTGDITALLAARYPAGEVHGIDLTHAMLALARQRGVRGAVFSRQDMCQLALPDDSIDILSGGYALRNAPALAGAAAEIHRVLKPGGTAALLDFSKPAAKVPQLLQYLLLVAWGSFWGLLLHRNAEVYAYIAQTLRRYPDRAALHRLFREMGFEVVSSNLFYFGMLEHLVLRKR